MLLLELGNPQILTRFGDLDVEFDMENLRPGKDRWFGYSQFDWLQDLHVHLGRIDSVAGGLHQLGYLICFLAAFGKELRLPTNLWRATTAVFTILYLIRFLVKGTNFTNHNYLFPLLMILTILSGGGHVSSSERNQTSQDVRACEAATVALRAQFAILYGFASIWKLHSDWLEGRIVRSIFLSFEERNQANSIPWMWIEKELFPDIFAFLSVSGLFLDASMFAALTFLGPKTTNTHVFLIFTVLFHVFTTITMGKVIGYSFPGTCMAGLALFLPMVERRASLTKSYDQSLAQWIHFYFKGAIEWFYRTTQKPKSVKTNSGNQTRMEGDRDHDDHAHRSASDGDSDKEPTRHLPPRWLHLVVMGWIIWQVLFPLRMLYVSEGNFPFTRLGYRYSWTMMLHNSDFAIVRKHLDASPPQTILLLSYLVPTCFRHHASSEPDVFMPRAVYMGASSDHPMQDPRSVPMHLILGTRESAMLGVFPVHFLSRIAYGLGRVIDYNVGSGACEQQGVVEQHRMGMHAVEFARLNQHGPFSRFIDPTVDLVATAEAQARQRPWTTAWNALWDRRPSGHEFVLRGVGSLRREGLRREAQLRKQFPGATIALVADRAACLRRRPLWLRPMGYPYMIVPLELPVGVQLVARSALVEDSTSQINWKDQRLWPGQLEVVQTFSLEIGLSGQSETTRCGDTKQEDVLFALLYKEESQ